MRGAGQDILGVIYIEFADHNFLCALMEMFGNSCYNLLEVGVIILYALSRKR